jgi:hypothetical protein
LILLTAFLLRRRRAGKTRASSPARTVPASPVAQITGLSEAEAAARQIPFDPEAQKEAEWRRFRRKIARRHLLTFFNLDMIGAAIVMYLLGSAWSAILSLLVLVLSFGLNVFQEVHTKRTWIKSSRNSSPKPPLFEPGECAAFRWKRWWWAIWWWLGWATGLWPTERLSAVIKSRSMRLSGPTTAARFAS